MVSVNDDLPTGTIPSNNNNGRKSFWRQTANIGETLPANLYLGVDVDGNEVTLHKYRGQNVMICFYLFTQCGVCAYSIGKLMGNYKVREKKTYYVCVYVMSYVILRVCT